MLREPSIRADLVALIAWWRYLRGVRPTLVFAGTPKAGMLGIVAGFLAGVPCRVYHVRGLRLETSSGLSRLMYSMLERLVFGMATSALVVSQSLMDRLIELRLAPMEKLQVLGGGSSNGVDLHRFYSNREIYEESAGSPVVINAGLPTVGFVGRLHRDKGISVLIDASLELSKRGVQHKLLVVGGADDGTADEIARRLQRLSAPAVVTGAVEDVSPFYAQMDVLCLPSRREGFPNVVLEAAAAGVPAVVSNATGAIDSVVDGVTGHVFAMDDTEALADALEMMIRDERWRRRAGEAARQFVERTFDRSIVQGHVVEYLRIAAEGVDR